MNTPYSELEEYTANLMGDITSEEDGLYVEDKSNSGPNTVTLREVRRWPKPDLNHFVGHRITKEGEIPFEEEDVFDQPYYCITSYSDEYTEQAKEVAEDLDDNFSEVEIFTFL